MKVAICVYGTNKKCSCASFIQAISQKYLTYVFLHQWDHDEFANCQIEAYGKNLHTKISNYKKIENEIKTKRNSFVAEKDGCLPDTGYLSLLYGMCEVNKLKNQIQSKNAFPFDCVFLLTYNSQIDIEINPEKYKLHDLNVAYECEYMFKPYIVFSESKNMDKFCSLYEKIDLFDHGTHQQEWMKRNLNQFNVHKFSLRA